MISSLVPRLYRLSTRVKPGNEARWFLQAVKQQGWLVLLSQSFVDCMMFSVWCTYMYNTSLSLHTHVCIVVMVTLSESLLYFRPPSCQIDPHTKVNLKPCLGSAESAFCSFSMVWGSTEGTLLSHTGFKPMTGDLLDHTMLEQPWQHSMLASYPGLSGERRRQYLERQGNWRTNHS